VRREHATVKNRAPVRRLWLWPLLLGVSVSVGSDVGWGVAETVALYAWLVPALVLGKSTWYLRHQY
jgi:hypothetical protein